MLPLIEYAELIDWIPTILDYIITTALENGTTTDYTVGADTLVLLIDAPEGGYSVTVLAINGAGVGELGMPPVDRKNSH